VNLEGHYATRGRTKGENRTLGTEGEVRGLKKNARKGWGENGGGSGEKRGVPVIVKNVSRGKELLGMRIWG